VNHVLDRVQIPRGNGQILGEIGQHSVTNIFDSSIGRAKMAEPIELSFGMVSGMIAMNRVLDGHIDTIWQIWLILINILLSFIMPHGSTEKNTIIYTKYKNTFTKQNIKTDYKLKLQFILY